MDIDPKNPIQRLMYRYQTQSEIEPFCKLSAYFELYRDLFLEQLAAHGYATDADVESILEEMIVHENVGDFMDEPQEQIEMLSAFGLILLDRIVATGWGKTDPEHCFALHEQLFECYEHVRDKVKSSERARHSASMKYAKNRKAEDFVIAEWTAHRDAYDNNKSAFARDYVRRVKNEMDVTVTEKQMREVWLKNTPFAG